MKKPKRKRTKMSEADILDAEGLGNDTKKENNKNGKFDPYQVITDKIIDYMESGKFEELPRLWSRIGGPKNAHTGRAYNGINVMLLMMRMAEEGWANPLFLTFNQVKAVSKKFEDLIVKDGDKDVYPVFVKKGSKGEQICFWKRIEIKNRNEDEDEGTRTIPLLRLYTVFNVDQLEMHPKAREYLERHKDNINQFKNDGVRNEAIDQFVLNVGMDLRHSAQGIAAYNWAKDQIGMPFVETFKSMDAYYAVLFHEHIHGTGHESRLNRDLKNRFGTEAYAFEELVAEFGASFLCADFQIFQESWRHHAEYVRIWTKRMKEDKHAVFTAASLANAAVNFLWNKQPEDTRKNGDDS